MEFAELECVQESALQLLLRLKADGLFINTTLSTLNEVISITPGTVNEIDGEISAGKTQICYSIVAKFFSTKQKARVYWISQIPIRSDMLKRHLIDDTHLERLIFKCPEKIQDLIFDLDNILKVQEKSKVELLFLENVDALLHDTVYQQIDSGRKHQSDVVEKLNNLARNGVTVIVTNHITSWRGYPAPALGEYWSSLIKNRFLVEKVEGNDDCRVISTVKPGQPQACEMKFRITAKGLKKF